jgi:hypothetical protein
MPKFPSLIGNAGAIGRRRILHCRIFSGVQPLHCLVGQLCATRRFGASKEGFMRWRWGALLAAGAFVAHASAVMAHHSNSMFDLGNLIDLEGVVQEFKFSSPHSFIILQVKGDEGIITLWNLEGQTPAALTRDGWSKKTLKGGDELKLRIAPLRSGAPGGWWTTEGTSYRDGKPIPRSE